MHACDYVARAEQALISSWKGMQPIDCRAAAALLLLLLLCATAVDATHWFVSSLVDRVCCKAAANGS
jgi:hypothetical protein